MIIHNITQGTTEWLAVRAGIPTASNFDKIITKSGKPSTQAEKYLHRLLAERMMGHPVIEHVSFWMGRGNQMEAEAISYYEGVRELDTVPVGFVTNDERTIGASPDRFVGEDGLLEIKVPAEHTHVAYLLTRAVDAEYYPQVQGQLWVTGRAWADILSYHPEMPPALIRVPRDDKFITSLAAAVTAFSGALEDMAADARAKGWIKDVQEPGEPRPTKASSPAEGSHEPGSPSGGGWEVESQALKSWLVSAKTEEDKARAREELERFCSWAPGAIADDLRRFSRIALGELT